MQAYNWYSVPEQVESVRKLLPYDFVHICPGADADQVSLCQTCHTIIRGLHKVISCAVKSCTHPQNKGFNAFAQGGSHVWPAIAKIVAVPSCSVLCRPLMLWACAGHGRPGHLKDAAHREELINELLASEGAL